MKIKKICLQNGSSFEHLKVHKRENFLGFDFEICTFSLLVMPKCKGFV